MKQNIIHLKNFEIGNQKPFILICGPCQIESAEHSKMMVEEISEICLINNINFIFKASFDKANRTSIETPRGVGIEKGLTILDKISDEFDCPTLTDVHEVSHCEAVGKIVDVVQIPAFLCRQTDLLIAAGKTGKIVNIKKGQFLSPAEMAQAAQKVESTGNNNIMLCERGTSFGYNNLINDFRSLPIMSETGYPVVFDATHSVQQPGSRTVSSGGQSKFVATLAQAACAVGIAAIFIETHENPVNSPSDGANMLSLFEMKSLITRLKRIDDLIKNFSYE